MQSVTLSLFRFGSMTARAWAFGQMATARFALAQVPDLGFFKLCGSGIGEGFTPLPNTAVYAILATWPEQTTAEHRLSEARVFRRYRAWASDTVTFFLRPVSARGRWSGTNPFKIGPTPEADPSASGGPVAALTRATIKPHILLRFWGRVPAISKVIGADPNVRFKIGIGEIPWLHQVTFSVWPDTATMDGFARKDGPHAQAIRAVRDGAWFSEELYARFSIDRVTGNWDGREMRARLGIQAAA